MIPYFQYALLCEDITYILSFSYARNVLVRELLAVL